MKLLHHFYSTIWVRPFASQDGGISQLQSNVYLNWFETCAALVAKVTNQ